MSIIHVMSSNPLNALNHDAFHTPIINPALSFLPDKRDLDLHDHTGWCTAHASR
jgi:hypothetical protein